MKRIVLLIQLCFFIAVSTVYSQKKSLEIGGKIINELADWSSYGPGVGIQINYKLTKHSGIETGLCFKINPRPYFFDEAGNYSMKRFSEKVIMLPLLYRFESRLINFTGGFALDYLINQNTLKKKPPSGLTENYYNRTEWVSTISVSKNFYLKRSLVFEPEIRASAYVPAGGGGVGLNFSLRKKIF